LLKIKEYEPDLICYFLMGQAEDLYKGYFQFALELNEKFHQIVAINRLLDKHAPASFNPRILKNEWSDFFIPSFNLEICKEIEDDSLFKAGKIDLNNSIENELDRIHGMGVNIL
jgi:hypothetical protein